MVDLEGVPLTVERMNLMDRGDVMDASQSFNDKPQATSSEWSIAQKH